ncbi:MAG: hypothetical protein Q7T20_18035 [Saprospiraceae bacterium]|nr:hypothetical protein [Saprospiraceae bacterium]
MKPLLILTVLSILTGHAFAQPRNAKALVVGISQHQDTSIHAFTPARRDAEEYAAFLQTISGGSMDRDQILLLTDQGATLASFVAALDWLLDTKPLPLKRLLYIAGAAQMVAPGQKNEDVFVFFHDSPAAPLQGNTFSLRDLKRLLDKGSGQNIVPFTLVFAFKEAFETGTDAPLVRWKDEGKNQRSSYLKWSNMPSTDPLTVNGTNPEIAKTISSHLVTGLFGLADRDNNMQVNGQEIFRYLKSCSLETSVTREYFYMAVTDKEASLSRVDDRIVEELQRLGKNYLFAPIVHLESMPIEDRVLQTASPATRQLYEDFILAIKVKNFLKPVEHNAAALYDSLLLVPELQPIAGHLRRRYAAAMLDHTQQALNAYLNTSANELTRRRKNSGQYKLYAQLMGKANELLGEEHFMHKTLEAKRLYFEGLHLRLQYFATKNAELLSEALKKQLAALRFEPEAAYIYNELGVVYGNQNDTIEAQKQFFSAIEYSPTWGIPYGNLCGLFLRAGDWENANEYGIRAVALANWNPDTYFILGTVYHKKRDFSTAEDLYRRAIKEGTSLPEVYFNLACIAAQKEEKDAALDWLKQAREMGFDDIESLATDPDLVSIRKDARFTEMVQQLNNERMLRKKD